MDARPSQDSQAGSLWSHRRRRRQLARLRASSLPCPPGLHLATASGAGDDLTDAVLDALRTPPPGHDHAGTTAAPRKTHHLAAAAGDPGASGAPLVTTELLVVGRKLDKVIAGLRLLLHGAGAMGTAPTASSGPIDPDNEVMEALKQLNARVRDFDEATCSSLKQLAACVEECHGSTCDTIISCVVDSVEDICDFIEGEPPGVLEDVAAQSIESRGRGKGQMQSEARGRGRGNGKKEIVVQPAERGGKGGGSQAASRRSKDADGVHPPPPGFADDVWAPAALSDPQGRGFVCKACTMPNCAGKRYRCHLCPDFDICERCFTIRHLVHPRDHAFDLQTGAAPRR